MRHLTRRQSSPLVIGAVGLLVLSGCAASPAESGESSAAGTEAAAGAEASDFWDSSTVHSLSVDVDPDALDDLLSTYEGSGEKVWIEATVTIDGVTHERVGLKLKGNSSLRGVTSDDDPSTIPWIIRLDKYVDGQNHGGTTEFVVRGKSSETALNEAVALELLESTSLASEAAAATRFTIGDSTSLRLVVENPGDAWNESTLLATALYKAESGGDYSYRGDDPDSYTDVFDQEAGEDDLTPLISFLEFINDSDDETFAAELDEHLDVTAFATYLAFHDLVDNFDDIDGPGNNSYLAYDAETGLMTVVSWDLNLAFGASPTSRGDQGGPADGADAGGEGMVNAPQGARPDGERPDGAGSAGQAGGGMAAGGGSNILSERFLADEDFSALYESELDRLTEALYESGDAQAILDDWESTLVEGASDLVDAETITAEADELSDAFQRRADDATS